MVEYIVTFVELHFPFYLGLTNFIVRILQELSIFYPLCTIKQLSIFPFFEPFSKRRLNQVAEKDGGWAGYELGCRRCRHTIARYIRFTLWSKFKQFLRSRHYIKGYWANWYNRNAELLIELRSNRTKQK